MRKDLGHGVASHVNAWLGPVRHGNNTPRKGSRFFGAARHGKAMPGMAGQTTLPARGEDFTERHGRARRGEAWLGEAESGVANNTPRKGRRFRGQARPGEARHGGANNIPRKGNSFYGKPVPGTASRGKAWHSCIPRKGDRFPGVASPGVAESGSARLGSANNTPQRWGEDFVAWLGRAVRCRARPCRARQTTLPLRGEKISGRGRTGQGTIRPGLAWQTTSPERGTDFMAWPDRVWPVSARHSRANNTPQQCGEDFRAGRGGACKGLAGQGAATTPPEREEDFLERQRKAGLGGAKQGRAWQGKKHSP